MCKGTQSPPIDLSTAAEIIVTINSMPKSSTSLKHEMVRQDIDEKWKRTMMTPTGVKIIRIQPSLNYDSLRKYQNRSDLQSPTVTSTPVLSRTPQRTETAVNKNGNRATSATPSTGTQISRTSTVQPGEMAKKPPAPVRPASSRSCPSATYNSRSRSCQPTHMYMKDNLRRVAKLNRPASHVHSCSQTIAINEQTPKQPRSPRRFDGTVVNLPKFVQSNEFLTHEDLSMGQKQYIWGIARIYSMSNLMDLKQRQYQNLLDYDFHRNMQDKKLKEYERLREWREYQRYTKFIKRYEQRIPRAAMQNRHDSVTPCQEVSHIHRHVIKGWTTNPHSDEAYRPLRGGKESDENQEEVHSVQDGRVDDEALSGHYRLVIVKTPQTENDSPKEAAGSDKKLTDDGVNSDETVQSQQSNPRQQLPEKDSNIV